MACFYRIDEMALGATGSGSIAAVMSRFGEDSTRGRVRHGETEWRNSVKKNSEEERRIANARAEIEKAKRLKAAQKPRLGDFVRRLISRKGISEAMDIAGITSQLKGLENKNNYDNRNTVTYGVEDDEGNLMKVTVKAEDAKSFENRLALELGEVENNKIYGYQNSGISLAEVLYNLKDEFTIVDVEFPEIPSDIIYNADKASLGEQTPDPNIDSDQNQEQDQFGPDDEFGTSGQPPMSGPDDLNGGMEEQPVEGGDEFGDEDFDQGEDFIEGGDEDEFKTMFNQLIQLMTAQAEKEKAVADAEAEKARALQAEYSAKAANHEITRQEELVRMQAEVDAQKKKEKDAKQMADIAKYRVNRDKGANAMNFESTGSFLKAVLGEDVQLDGDLDNENMVRRELLLARQKYQALPTDDEPTKAYKQQAMQQVSNQLQAKLRQIRAKATYNQREKQLAAKNAQQQQQQNQQNGQQNPNVQNPNANGLTQ